MSSSGFNSDPLLARLRSLCATIFAECDSLRCEINTLRAEASILRKQLATREAQYTATGHAVLAAVNSLIDPCGPPYYSEHSSATKKDSGTKHLVQPLNLNTNPDNPDVLNTSCGKGGNGEMPIKVSESTQVACSSTPPTNLCIGASSGPSSVESSPSLENLEAQSTPHGTCDPAMCTTYEAVTPCSASSDAQGSCATTKCEDSVYTEMPVVPCTPLKGSSDEPAARTVPYCNAAPPVVTKGPSMPVHSPVPSSKSPTGLLGKAPSGSCSGRSPSLLAHSEAKAGTGGTCVTGARTESSTTALTKEKNVTGTVDACRKCAFLKALATKQVSNLTLELSSADGTRSILPTTFNLRVRDQKCPECRLGTAEKSQHDNLGGEYSSYSEKGAGVIWKKPGGIYDPCDDTDSDEISATSCINPTDPSASYSSEEVRLANYYTGNNSMNRAVNKEGKKVPKLTTEKSESSKSCIAHVPSGQTMDEESVVGASICFRPPFNKSSAEEVRLAYYNTCVDRHKCVVRRKRTQHAPRTAKDIL